MRAIGISLVFLGSVFVLSGCSLSSVEQSVNNAIQRVMEKDQANEQWFEVTTTFLYDHYLSGDKYLDLKNVWLTSIPDVCGLMSSEDAAEILFLNLANNTIRIVDQDLSCLTNLKVLNLSYNDIVEVVSLGSLPALQELLLHKNQIDDSAQLSNIDAPALQKLNIWYNQLKSLVNIDRFKELTSLEIQHNQIEQIIGVENLGKLEQLRAEFNNLSALPFLDSLQQLKQITVGGNQVDQGVLDKIQQIVAPTDAESGSTN